MQQSVEGREMHPKLRKARGKVHANHRREHLRRRIEGLRRQGEEQIGRPVHLRRRGEHAVVTYTGSCRDPLRNLALHHQDSPVHQTLPRRRKQVQQNVRGDVVRKVSDHIERLARRRNLRKVRGQHIYFKNGHVRLFAKAKPQLRCQRSVQLQCDQAACPWRQQFGDRTVARPNLHHRARSHVAQSVGDALPRLVVDEKILSQFRFFRHLSRLSQTGASHIAGTCDPRQIHIRHSHDGISSINVRESHEAARRKTVDWTPGGISSDLEDRRDDSGGGGGFGFGGGGGGIGIIGFIVLLVISLITGHNFLGGLFSGGGSPDNSQSYGAPTSQYGPAVAGQGAARPHPAGEDRDVQLISFVLDDVQKTWTGIFDSTGNSYRHAKLVVYRNATYSGCGTAQAATGPFYCPEDQKVYIDLSFWDELKQFGGSTADAAQAYVIAHELGHHVQQLLGIEAKEQQALRQHPSQHSQLSVDTELQADCFAGVWAHAATQRGIFHPDDVSAALSAAAAVGDDHLQRMSGRAVSPETWTHGSSAEREQWFRAGLDQGTIDACNTFNGQIAP